MVQNDLQFYLVDIGAFSSLDRLNAGLICSGSQQKREGHSGGAGDGCKRRNRGQCFTVLL